MASGLPGPGPLISVGALLRLLGRGAQAPAGARGEAGIAETPPVLLDVRWRLGGPPGIGDYAAGHIPDAVFVDLDADLAAPVGDGSAGRHPLPDPEEFTTAMRRAGVRGDRPVVVYDAADSTAAARAWWLLRYFGHPSVRVLDGGFRAWRAAGLAVTAAAPARTAARPARVPGDFTADAGHMPLLDAAGAAALARVGVLLDARAAERYRGEFEPVDPVAGHIPGAVSAPTADNVSPDGNFRTAGELRNRFAALVTVPGAGVRAAARPAVGAYCGSGVTAAHEVLALAVAGIPAALYPGSWSEWVADPSRPVAAGGSRG